MKENGSQKLLYSQNEKADLSINISTHIGATIAVKNKRDGSTMLKCKGEENTNNQPREYFIGKKSKDRDTYPLYKIDILNISLNEKKHNKMKKLYEGKTKFTV